MSSEPDVASPARPEEVPANERETFVAELPPESAPVPSEDGEVVEVTPTDESPEETPAVTIDRRVEWAERVRALTTLPQSLREPLAALVESRTTANGDEPLVPLGPLTELLREAVPTLTWNAPATAMPHPQGEAFFASGVDGNELTPEQAQRLALEQIARAGFARKANA